MVAKASACAAAIVVACAGWLAWAGAGPAWVATALALAFLPYAGLVVAEVPHGREATAWALALAGAAGVVLVIAPSALSDDLYRYLWDGRVSGAGIDPYLYAPNDPALFSLREALFARVNNPEIPTIYPPLAQLLFWLADRIDHAPWTLKLLALGAHLSTVVLVSRAAPVEHGGRAALLYGVNPLALSESALGGHVDVFAGLALLAFAVALVRRRRFAAVAAVVVATGTKLVGLVVAPLLASHDRRAAALAMALCLGVAAPIFFAGSGSDAVAGVGHYARRWQGNAGLFTVLEAGARVAVDQVAEETWSADGHVRIRALAPVVAFLEGTPFDLWATQIAEKKEAADRTDFQRAYAASMLARGLAFALVLGLVFWLSKRRLSPLLATRFVVFAVLLLTPQLHPWYLLWLLPVEAALGRHPGLVFSATSLAAYAPLSTWLTHRRWVDSPVIALLIHLPVLVLLAWELRPHVLSTLPRPLLRPGLGKIQ